MSNNKKDTIFIGKKPLMTYVTSVIVLLADLPAVSIKARGFSIGRAVDVAQIILRKTNTFEIGQIKLDSESLESSDGRRREVSTIEIPLTRIGH